MDHHTHGRLHNMLNHESVNSNSTYTPSVARANIGRSSTNLREIGTTCLPTVLIKKKSTNMSRAVRTSKDLLRSEKKCTDFFSFAF